MIVGKRNSKDHAASENASHGPQISPGAAVERARAVFETLGLIRPTADLLFKKLMTESPEALLDLLNSILKPARPFVELEFLNPEVTPNADGAKAIRLDLLVETDAGTVVDIEIQACGELVLEQRAVYYVSRLVSASLMAGSGYAALPECIVIFIIEGEYFRNVLAAHRSFEFIERVGDDGAVKGQSLYPAAPKLHFVELGKLVSSGSRKDPILKGWVDFMLPQSVDDWERVAGGFSMFSELKKKVEQYSADDKLAMQQRAIDEGRAAQALQMGAALRQGIEQANKDTARSMLAEGLDKALICRVLKVTPEELEKLLA